MYIQGPLGHQLSGKTLGILGITGAIGSKVASVGRALGMRVLGTCSSSTRAELEHVLRESDVVSIHVPLTPQTRGLLGRSEFRLMKPTACLINTARAAIVDREALEECLRQGGLQGGVGLDVFWEEPADPREVLYQRPNVFCTPHVGVASEETYELLSAFLVDNILRVKRGEAPLHVLNHEYKDHNSKASTAG